MPSSVSAKQIRKLIHCADPKTWDGDIWYDNDNDELVEDFDLTPEPVPIRPLIKTETTNEGDDDVRTTVRTIPWSPAELAKLQEKYSRNPEESETEYVWRVSLTGGDRILLSEEEAGGYWGPGVFLTTTPGNHNSSLTTWAAYWAGGIDPQERGDPLVIKTSGFSDLAVSVQKAACIQAMYERDVLRTSPMLAPIDPARLTPLIRGLPDSLKTYVANVQDRIRATGEANAVPYRAPRVGRHNYRDQAIPTWSEFVQERVNYGRRMGWIGPTTGKPPEPPPRRVHQVHTTKPKSEFKLKFDKELKKVEQIRKGQSVIIRGPFRLLDIVRKGTAPPAGIAQKPTVRKWYAYLESINDIMPITEGSIKVSKLQKDIDSTLLFQTPPSKPSPIQEAPPLKEGSDLKGVWFTDASSYRQNNEWNYKAVALEVATGEKLSETGKGSAQVGELRAVLLATRHGASHIYTDSYAVFKGATEWVGHWAVNDWQVNRVPVWQADSWKQLLEIGEQRLLHIGWVKGHDRSASIAAQFNQQVDSLTRLQKIDVVSNEHEWERLLEWLHIKRGHTGRADLYREGIARGWPVSVKLCEQVVTACSQCRLRLNKDHPSKAPPLHIRDKKTLWHTWQIDYIGPL
ncbi:pol-like protein ENS-3 [Grus japonensis]|uniref:Pol-like protein ENS-3 n=1 Tax=Grus japonensis TaxID=30415 RepID=A0ABC9YFQ6_GRUJA